MTDATHPNGPALQGYHDGELDPTAAAEVERHCADCPACRAVLDDLARVETLLAGDPEPRLSRPLWRRVRPGRPGADRLRPALVIGACAAGVALGVLIGPLPSGDAADAGATGAETVLTWSGESTAPLLDVYLSTTE